MLDPFVEKMTSLLLFRVTVNENGSSSIATSSNEASAVMEPAGRGTTKSGTW